MKATLFKYLISSVLLLACLSVAQSQDMVANYPFNGNVNDASSFGNHASVHGALLAQDRFGNANKAFSFDGEQAYIQAPNAAQLNSDYVTVSLWVRPDALPEQGEVFLLSFGGWQERFKISLPGHGKPVFTTNSSSGISDMDAGDGNNLTVGEWGHVAVVHDGTNDKVYINGALANTKAVSGTLNSTDKPLGMGYDPIGAANFFNGALDEVAIFNGALSDQAIADLYAAQLIAPVVPPGMVANYAFSNNATDGTSYANHGTVTDARLTADRFGFGNSAYEFNGISSRIDAPNSNHLNSALASVSFWVKVNELPAQGEVFLIRVAGYQDLFGVQYGSWTLEIAN